METNTKKQMVEFKELTDEEIEKISQVSAKCLYILFEAIDKVAEEFDVLQEELFKEEQKECQN